MNRTNGIFNTRFVRNLQRRTARTAGTRRVEFSQRRIAQHVRSARLFSLGSVVSGLYHRQNPLHPKHFYRLYGRSARLQDPAAQIAASGLQSRRGCLPVFRQRCQKGERHAGLGAGVLPGRRSALPRTSRPDANRKDADGAHRGKRPAARRPLFRSDPEPRTGIYEGVRRTGLPARHSD